LKDTSSELNHVSKQDIIKEGGNPRDVKTQEEGDEMGGDEERVGGRDEVVVEKNEGEVDE